jgi:hypothetical protein
MLVNFREGVLNMGHFDSSVLLTLVSSLSARRQGTAENPELFYRLSLGTLWSNIVSKLKKINK